LTRLGFFAISLLVAAGSPAETAQGQGSPAPGGQAWSDSSPHRAYFVILHGVQLQCLDWGGDGPPLLLVHGLGDSPHIFDDLANRLKDHFHVIAYARRGHGKSGSPITGYDDQTLVGDLRDVMDEVRFKHASLIGWGMGGNEVTAFAGRYPERVDKIVYLEGGYDWSTTSFYQAFRKIFAANQPTRSDGSSVEALRAWYRAARLGNAPWTDGLEAFLRDAEQFDRTGVAHLGPSELSSAGLMATLGTWRRDYKKVQAPALALYATTFFPTDRSDPVLSQQLRDFEQNVMVPFRRASMERIARELRNVEVQQIADRTHISIGVEQTDTLAALISEFLLSQP